MLGLGEKENEVFETLEDLRNNNVDIVTLGQYLQPSKKHLPVKEFITPDQFEVYEKFGKKLGFRHVESGPLVRSSYKAVARVASQEAGGQFHLSLNGEDITTTQTINSTGGWTSFQNHPDINDIVLTEGEHNLKIHFDSDIPMNITSVYFVRTGDASTVDFEAINGNTASDEKSIELSFNQTVLSSSIGESLADFTVNVNGNEKELHIKNFIQSIKTHISSISKKDYTKLLKINSPDYVFIFMPHEYAFITAQKYDNTLAAFSQQKQIVIVGPSTLIMCMKLVESIWKLEKQNKNSKEIAEIAGGMFDQIAKSINLLDKTEQSIQKSLDSINQSKNFIKDGRGSLFNKANKMRNLGANTKINVDNIE